MRSGESNVNRGAAIEDHFERKSRELVVPDDEIEAWELDTRDLSGLDGGDFSVPRDD